MIRFPLPVRHTGPARPGPSSSAPDIDCIAPNSLPPPPHWNQTTKAYSFDCFSLLGDTNIVTLGMKAPMQSVHTDLCPAVTFGFRTVKLSIVDVLTPGLPASPPREGHAHRAPVKDWPKAALTHVTP